MNEVSNNRWLHRFAVLTALATLGLICIGGLVTSHEAGMSVPDWPNSYGYNMFLFPPSKWIGGILYEHTHRLLASTVGLLIVVLTRWLGGRESRRTLAIVGVSEMVAGIAVMVGIVGFIPQADQKATGGFLMGIGGIILLAALVWFRNKRSANPLPQLGWLALALVQVQGLLGGLRVVLFKNQIGIFHAALAQCFFVLLCAIALLTSKWWINLRVSELKVPKLEIPLRGPFIATTALIFLQLILGATMRHQHAGLSIHDFPLAYGKLWPATDPASIANYNEHRVEITDYNPITAFQVQLQMVHRLVALLILVAVAFCAWKSWRKFSWSNPITKVATFWLGLILCQVVLGAATVLSGKAADIATAHVLVGALSLATGAILSIIAFHSPMAARQAAVLSRAETQPSEGGALAARPT